MPSVAARRGGSGGAAAVGIPVLLAVCRVEVVFYRLRLRVWRFVHLLLLPFKTDQLGVEIDAQQQHVH